MLQTFNPSRGCIFEHPHRPRVSPAVIYIQALRALAGISDFFHANLSGSHAGLPLRVFLPGSFQTGISYVACPSAIAQGPLHSQLSVLNSSLLVLHFLGSFRPIPSHLSFQQARADGVQWIIRFLPSYRRSAVGLFIRLIFLVLNEK